MARYYYYWHLCLAITTLFCCISTQQSVQVESFTTVSKVLNSATQHKNRFSSENVSSVTQTSLHLSGGGAPVRTKQKDQSAPVLEKKPIGIIREMVAEMIGTFMIVQLGCGVVCSALYKSAQVGLWQIAVVWGLAVTLAIYCTAGISGAHLNPAISFAFALLRNSDFKMRKVPLYTLAQLAGATMAGLVNFSLFFKEITLFEADKGIVRGTLESTLSASAFGEYWSTVCWKGAFCGEAFGTAILAFVIFSVTNKNNKVVPPNAAPPLIGATVASIISFLAPLTQAGLNPARDFGPRIVTLLAGWKSVAMDGWWVYVLAPFIGAPIGAFVADQLLWKQSNQKE